ncbi:MAG: CBS domain-containing protein [Candidatus Thermoplasmatota archaeon]|nr:CBS domain-containing protein [Candidatus Thermoplasmatota archaeon]
MHEEKVVVPEFYKFTVEEIMDKRLWDLPLIEKDTDVEHVLAVLSGKSHVWVVESKETKKLVGVITEHDILSILAPKKLPSYVFGIPDVRTLHEATAGSIMSKKLIKCAPKTTIKAALDLMSRYGVRRLPVTENDVIIGEITLHHIIARYHIFVQSIKKQEKIERK